MQSASLRLPTTPLSVKKVPPTLLYIFTERIHRVRQCPGQCSVAALPVMIATSHVWLLSIQNVPSLN